MVNYNLIENLTAVISIEQFQLVATGIGDPLKIRSVPYSFLVPTRSEMESIIKATNSLAENVVLFYRKGQPIIDQNTVPYSYVKNAVIIALKNIVEKSEDINFVAKNVEVLHEKDPDDWFSQSEHFYQTTRIEDDYLTKVFISYFPNILSPDEFILPNYPGAIINDYAVSEYKT